MPTYVSIPDSGRAGAKRASVISPAMLDTLPSDLLLRVLGNVDQDTKTHGVFLASKRMYAASRAPALWREVRLTDVGPSALAFLTGAATACETLVIYHSSPDDVGVFLEDLIERGGAARIETLFICIDGRCTRVPDFMLEAACTGFPALKRLCIHLEGGVEDHNELRFPDVVNLANLEQLEIIEMPEMGAYDELEESMMVVMFGDSFESMPALECITLDVASSDVMSSIAKGLPKLRRLSYTSEFEAYDDVTLPGALDLDYLSLSVHDDSDVPNLLRALADTARIGMLSIRAHTDVTFDVGLPAIRLCVHVLEPGAVCQFDYFTLKDEFCVLEHLSVRSDPMNEEEACIKFVCVPSTRAWIKMHAQYRFQLSQFARVELEPAFS